MNPERNDGQLPRYDIRDDEKTRPCVVLYDWNDDDATAHLEAAATPRPPRAYVEDVDDTDDIDVDMFRPRWHGIGRRPGTMALAVVLGISVTIVTIAVLGAQGANETQAESVDVGFTAAALK
jgi:hypothetical protein